MSKTRTISRRLGYGASFLVVAGVAAYVSYGHIFEVARLGHQPDLLAKALPLSVDGLMLIATLAMAEDKAANRSPRGWARFSFWFGAAVSVAANISATAVRYGDPLSIAVAAFAPLALLLAIEIVSRPGKPKDEPISAAVLPVVQAAQQVVAAEAARLPIPVSPATGTPGNAPATDTPERGTPVAPPAAGSGPVPRRASQSPLTGRVLSDRAPRV